MSNKILLGITGSVAASKSELLYNILAKDNNVKVIATSGGKRYLSKKFLDNESVYTSWDELPGSPHIELGRWADKFLIYPATANFISKMAMGIADDLLLSTILMHTKPVYIAPAMHQEMYLNHNIQSNLKFLSKNNIICGPRYGNLDIGDKGEGRLIEPEEFVTLINDKKTKIVVTSGGTVEHIDSVRTITNNSSGKQGRAIALELLARGYEITYIHASNIDEIPHANNIEFTNSESLMNILGREVVDASHLFMVAAVSDFVTDYTDKKLSRKNGALNITLRPNIDIIKSIVKNNPNIISIAFSAQLDDELRFEKLKDKNVNFLVINNIKNNQVGSDYNEVSIINSDRLLIKTNRLSKYEIAVLIIDNTVL